MADKAAKDYICSVITQSKIPPESLFPYTVYPSYVWKNSEIHGIAPRQINRFQSKQYLAKTNRVTKQSSLGEEESVAVE